MNVTRATPANAAPHLNTCERNTRVQSTVSL
jgi:hypothetical protein